jgi:RNA polymerase sigma-70 factor (ECF subfamily)
MFDNSNSYMPHTVTQNGKTHYYVFFEDGEGNEHDIEVTYPVYLEFLRFVKIERNLKRWTERHIEFLELSDEELFSRARANPKTVEEAILDKLFDEQFQQIIDELPEIQRRRFIRHYEMGLSFIQIAELEGCTPKAVEFSVKLAKKKVHELFKNIGYVFEV